MHLQDLLFSPHHNRDELSPTWPDAMQGLKLLVVELNTASGKKIKKEK